jgi:hypothetical protein
LVFLGCVRFVNSCNGSRGRGRLHRPRGPIADFSIMRAGPTASCADDGWSSTGKVRPCRRELRVATALPARSALRQLARIFAGVVMSVLRDACGRRRRESSRGAVSRACSPGMLNRNLTPVTSPTTTSTRPPTCSSRRCTRQSSARRRATGSVALSVSWI